MNSGTKKWSCGIAILAIIGLLLAAGGAYGQSAAFATITGPRARPQGGVGSKRYGHRKEYGNGTRSDNDDYVGLPVSV